MPRALRSPVVAGVLGRLHAQADDEDPQVAQRVRAREAQLGRRLPPEQRYELYGEAPLSITREVGQLLYLLALSTRPRLIVEFGSSLGVSTIYLAAAIRDGGGGTLITSECHALKVELASQNLADAGLADLVELRSGDALHTLANIAEPIDLVFLDGRNDLYLPILHLLEPRLLPSGLVVADLSADDPDLLPYLEYVRESARGYFSTTVPLDDGVELSTREGDGRP
ncbi:MAG TPA: class I SAM-dependent methyltransferase [Solirubrobacteraceae bacterium]|jgi:predicted O-methyltransferase YrrM|nr:class I SAM-dependent methyltransferase [Solirubrobacteraceae bacterium]